MVKGRIGAHQAPLQSLENMAEKFLYYKFQTEVNPFGVLFHPVAILDFLTRAHQDNPYTGIKLLEQKADWLILWSYPKKRWLIK